MWASGYSRSGFKPAGEVMSVWTGRPRRRDRLHILASPGRPSGPAGSTLRLLTDVLRGQLFWSGFCAVLPAGAVRSMAL